MSNDEGARSRGRGEPRGLRTAVAQQAMVLTDVVNRSLAEKLVGDPPKRLMIHDVDGPSTDGGKRARQAIVLAPVQEGDQGSAMCGFIDRARGEAELRTYASVAELHRRRYGRAFDVSQEEYDALVAELVELFSIDSVEVRFADSPPALAASGGGREHAAKIALALAAVLAAVATLLALR